MVKAVLGILSPREQDDIYESSHSQDGWEGFPIDSHQKYRTQKLINQWEAKARTASQSRESPRESGNETKEFNNQGTRTWVNQVSLKTSLLERKIKMQEQEIEARKKPGSSQRESQGEPDRGAQQKTSTRGTGRGESGILERKNEVKREISQEELERQKLEDENRSTLENRGGGSVKTPGAYPQGRRGEV
jgi:hypothetical protein